MRARRRSSCHLSLRRRIITNYLAFKEENYLAFIVKEENHLAFKEENYLAFIVKEENYLSFIVKEENYLSFIVCRLSFCSPTRGVKGHGTALHARYPHTHTQHTRVYDKMRVA